MNHVGARRAGAGIRAGSTVPRRFQAAVRVEFEPAVTGRQFVDLRFGGAGLEHAGRGVASRANIAAPGAEFGVNVSPPPLEPGDTGPAPRTALRRCRPSWCRARVSVEIGLWCRQTMACSSGCMASAVSSSPVRWGQMTARRAGKLESRSTNCRSPTTTCRCHRTRPARRCWPSAAWGNRGCPAGNGPGAPAGSNAWRTRVGVRFVADQIAGHGMKSTTGAAPGCAPAPRSAQRPSTPQMAAGLGFQVQGR